MKGLAPPWRSWLYSSVLAPRVTAIRICLSRQKCSVSGHRFVMFCCMCSNVRFKGGKLNESTDAMCTHIHTSTHPRVRLLSNFATIPEAKTKKDPPRGWSFPHMPHRRVSRRSSICLRGHRRTLVLPIMPLSPLPRVLPFSPSVRPSVCHNLRAVASSASSSRHIAGAPDARRHALSLSREIYDERCGRTRSRRRPSTSLTLPPTSSACGAPPGAP